MLSGGRAPATIVEAVRLGAADYVVKPGDAEGVGEARASTEGASSVVVAKAPPAAQLPQAGLTSVVALEPEPPAVVDPPTSLNLQELARHAAMGAEKEAIHRWNRRKTAAFLEVSYKTLLNKMKECGISEPRATN